MKFNKYSYTYFYSVVHCLLFIADEKITCIELVKRKRVKK